jgi:PTS system N-acetylgalactosamine-specific IIC component
MIITILILSIVGAVILLDKMAIGEFGISQPIIACPIIGLLFGEFNIGLLLGGVLQLVWVGALPLGAKEPLDNQGAGVVAIAVYILAKKIPAAGSSGQIIFTCLLFAGLSSIIGQSASQILKKINNRLFTYVGIASSDASISLIHLTGLLTSFIRGFVITILFLLLFIVILPLVKLLPDFDVSVLLILPLTIGIAGIAHLVLFQKRIFYGLLGVFTGIILWVLLKL